MSRLRSSLPAINASENALKTALPELRGSAAPTLLYGAFVLALALAAALVRLRASRTGAAAPPSAAPGPGSP